MKNINLDYRFYLQVEFSKRLEKNARYSLRAYARDLKMSPGKLSEVLSKKQGLAVAKAQEIVEILNWDQDQSSWFNDLVLANHGKESFLKQAAKARIHERFKLEGDNKKNVKVIQEIVMLPEVEMRQWLKDINLVLKDLKQLQQKHKETIPSQHYRLEFLLETVKSVL